MKFEFEGETYSFCFRYQTHEVTREFNARQDAVLVTDGNRLPMHRMRPVRAFGCGPGYRTLITHTKITRETACCLSMRSDEGRWSTIKSHSVLCSPKDLYIRTAGREKALALYKKDNPFMSTQDGFEKGLAFYWAMRQAWVTRLRQKPAMAGSA